MKNILYGFAAIIGLLLSLAIFVHGIRVGKYIDEQTIFLITGFISGCAFLATRDVTLVPLSWRPVWAMSEKGVLILALLAIVSSFSSLFILAYGFVHLDWWKPVIAMIFFTLIYKFVVRATIGYCACMIFGNILSVLSVIVVIRVWFF